MHPQPICVQLTAMTSKARSGTRNRWFQNARGLLRALVFALPVLLASGEAWSKPKVHVVYQGQRLGSIAKRYNVTVDELCAANGIARNAPIHPGQKLAIPGTDDGKGRASDSAAKGDTASPAKPAGKAQIHVVAPGHTLSAIAGRYAVTVSAIENANDISRKTALKVGQKLVVPHKSDKDGAYARKQRLRGHFEERTPSSGGDEDARAEKSWEKYVQPAWRRGYIKIRRYNRYWAGYVIGPKQEVLGHASNKINYVLGATEDGPRIDSSLIRLIASISDKFGGREMRIVSGYRTKSFVAASKHKEGKALDFSIPGIPNEALRDYLRTVQGVGVGFYPNSSFVHLDVRGYNSYWVDYAGPGEAPRRSSTRTRVAARQPTEARPDEPSASPGPEGDSPADGPLGSESGDEDSAGAATAAPGGDEGSSKDGDRTASKRVSGTPRAKSSGAPPASEPAESPKNRTPTKGSPPKGSSAKSGSAKSRAVNKSVSAKSSPKVSKKSSAR